MLELLLRWKVPAIPGLALLLLLLGCVLVARRCAGPDPRPPIVITRTDTVTVERIVRQEPPAKPGLAHRAAYRDVAPTRVQVAPGAGAELLATVCDTPRAQPVPDSPRAVGEAPSPPAAPALPYAWKLRDGWTPWSAHHLQYDEVGKGGLRVIDLTVHTPAEGRFLPVDVTREARLWRRILKPLPFVAAVAAAGWAAGRFTR